MTDLAAILFAVITCGVIAFQIALALGAPWGAYAMGGAVPGRYPPRLRVAAIGQAVLLGVLAVIVLSSAGLIEVAIVSDLPSLIWIVVAFSAVSVGLNSISRSAGERRIWVPVALLMLGSSLIVAVGGP